MTTIHEAWSKLIDALPAFAAKAAPLYVHNDWRWAIGGENRAPTAEEIESLAASLAWEARTHAEENGSHSSVSSGRLLARFACYDGEWSARIYLAPEYTI
jgi:hypothetical protein